MADGNRRAGIPGLISNPVVFSSLALLVTEAVIGMVVATSRMSGGLQFACVCMMAFLFLVVVAAVTGITIKCTPHGYEDIVWRVRSARR